MTTINTEEIDLHVGERVRLRRKALQLSQSALADALDLTFQQVQKYERGANRISASKLMGIADVLRVPVSYFFEGLPEFETTVVGSGEQAAASFLRTVDGVELAAAFSHLSPTKRRAVVTVVKSLAAL